MLVVSEENQSFYCLSAHTMIGKLNGFSDEQIMQIRQGQVEFDHRLNALISFVKSVIAGRQKELNLLENCFNAGYNQENIIDILHVIGDGYMTNYTTKVLNVPIDFPIAEKWINCEIPIILRKIQVNLLDLIYFIALSSIRANTIQFSI